MIPWHTKLDATHRCPAGHFYRCAKGARCQSEEEVLVCDAHARGGHRRHRQEMERVAPSAHFHHCYIHGLYRCVEVQCGMGVRSSATCTSCDQEERHREAVLLRRGRANRALSLASGECSRTLEEVSQEEPARG